MVRIFNDPIEDAKDDEEIVTLGEYIPWGLHKKRGGSNDDYDKLSGLILDVKSKQQHAIKSFADNIDQKLESRIAVCYVPSHEPSKTSSGIQKVAESIASRNSRIDATACLKRHVEVPKLAHGGDRSIDVHLDSIVANDVEKIAGRSVIIFDDVTTSGNSLRACRKILLDAGATRVRMYALGKTTN